MSAARITEERLQAYVDGRLSQAERAAVEAELAADATLAGQVAAYRAQNETLCAAFAPVLDEPVPERLLRAAQPRRANLWRVAAALAWIALGGVLGWVLNETVPPARQVAQRSVPIAHDAAIAHATYSPEVRHPVEVGADQEAHLVAWLSKRLGAPVRAPKLESVGYRLMGGRLLPGENGPVAHFMYQCEKGTRVTLYVRTRAPDNGETAFRYADEGNVRVFYWIDRSFGYALSSADISRERLLKVANAAYQQLNP